MTMYIKIDENGDPEGYPIVENNIYYIMGNRFGFTEEELRQAGYATLVNGDMLRINGNDLCDIDPGDIIKNEDGTIEQLWIVSEIDNTEKRNRWLEAKRHNLLYMSDWTQLPDSPLSAEKKLEWSVYRQALRDLPSNTDFDLILKAEDIDWPTVPGEPTTPPTSKPLASKLS